MGSNRKNRSGDEQKGLAAFYELATWGSPSTHFSNFVSMCRWIHIYYSNTLPTGPLAKVTSLLVSVYMTIAPTGVTASYLHSPLLWQVSSPLCCYVPTHALLPPFFSPCKFPCYFPPGCLCSLPSFSLWSILNINDFSLHSGTLPFYAACPHFKALFTTRRYHHFL